MRWIQMLVILLIIIFGISFATLNHQLVSVNYYFNQGTLPLAVLLALTFSLGCLMGAGMGLFWVLKEKMRYLNLKMHCRTLEKTVQQSNLNMKENKT